VAKSYMAVCFNFDISQGSVGPLKRAVKRVCVCVCVSQGSVATYLRCAGIFKYGFVANLRMSLSVKEFYKIG